MEYTIYPYPLSNANKNKIIKKLNNEDIIIFPTETVYGLGGNAFSKKVVEKIYKIKKRPFNKPLPILINKKWLNDLFPKRSSKLNKIIEEFWPGPLTLILNINKDFDIYGKSIALRWSNSKIVQKLIQLGNCPLIGTSANISGEKECLSIYLY